MTGRNEYACTDTAWVTVRTVAEGDVFLPSGFTPNNDGLNDCFYVIAGPMVQSVQELLIFNRWGEKVFERKQTVPNNPRMGWDGRQQGRELAPGAYVYNIVVAYADGKTRRLKGTVVLVK